jgi:hypothetical protein
VVVNNLEKFYLILRVLFGHVNEQFHLYHFYRDDLLIDRMMVIHCQVCLTMLIVQEIDIEVHKQESMHVEPLMIQRSINNFLKQLKSIKQIEIFKRCQTKIFTSERSLEREYLRTVHN